MMGRDYQSTHTVLGIFFAFFVISAFYIPILATPGTKYGQFQAAPTSPRAATAPGSSDPIGDEWPMFRGELNHTGMITTTTLQASGPIWSYTTAGVYVSSSAAVVGGRVYVGGGDSKVYCLNATSGAFIWSYTTGGDIQSSPAFANGRVYVGSWDHKVYCLNATTGTSIWNYTTGYIVESSPAVLSGRVYVGSDDNKLYCLNTTTGTRIWNYTTGNYVISSPAIASGRVYVGSLDHKVYCLNATTGAHMWDYTTGNEVLSSPVVAGGRVHVGSVDNKTYCLNAISGAFIWSYTTGNYIIKSAAVAYGYVYVGSRDHKVYCLNATTGAHMWDYSAGDDIMSDPTVASGCVYVGCEDFKVYCLNAITGAFIWSYTTGFPVKASPAIASGRVYVGSCDHNVYCLPMILGVPPLITHPADVDYMFGTTGHIISWTISDTTTSTRSFTLYRNGSSIATGSWTSGLLTTVNVDGLLFGHYSYTIVASDGYGGVVQDTVIVTVLLLPSAPQNLQASGGDEQVMLSWQAPASNGGSVITGYKIYRGMSPGSETLYATLNAATTTYTDIGVTNGQTYYYTITATNAIGESTRIIEVQASPSMALYKIILIISAVAAAGVAVVIATPKMKKIFAVKRQARAEHLQKIEEERQRQAEIEREYELQIQRQREVEAARERELQVERQQEAEAARERELEMERQREAEAARQRQLEHDVAVQRFQDIIAEARAAIEHKEFENARSLVNDSRTLAGQASIADSRVIVADLSRDIDDAEKAELRSKEEQDRLDKLRKIIRVSESLEITRLATLLKIDEQFMWDHIIDWAEQFGFKIKENIVIFGQGDTGAFLDELQRQFDTWDGKTKSKDGKI